MKKNQQFILGFVVLTIVVALISGWFGWKSGQKMLPQETSSASSPVPTNSTAQSESETIEEELPPAKVVFKCNEEGKTVYTDRPCSSGPPTDTMILRDAEPEKSVNQSTTPTSK